MRTRDLPLRRLSLRFFVPEREAAYRAAQYSGSLWLLRWGLGLGVLVQLLYLYVDVLVLGERCAPVWLVRLALSIPVGSLAFLASLHPRFAAIHQPVAAAVVLVTGLAMLPVNLAFDGDVALYSVLGTLVVAMYGYVLVGLRFAWAAPLVGIVVALDLLALWVLDTPGDLLVNAAQVLLITFGILTVGAYRLEMTARLANITAEQLLEQERQARAADTARIGWLENLAHFLRHEMRNSVTGVRTSLELLERHTNPEVADQVYFVRARQGLEVIRRLLESASHVSSLESSFLQDELVPLDLGALVSAEVEGQRVMHPDVDFDLALKAKPLRVEGNPERLIQLVQNLLSNALDHQAPGTPIVIGVARAGRWARLTVDNQGPSLPPEGDAIFDLFASFRAQTEPESKRGLGLYLVRLIAERYGGSACAEDRAGGVRFEVRLPLLRTPRNPTPNPA